ncbi:MAG: cytochrome c oxidase accessory protein CcoG [Gammaproteobacteria bacterium]
MNAPLTDSESYYVSEGKVYPREVSGRYASRRTLAVWVLLGLFYVMPWVPWNGRQAVLFDLPARKFYIFSFVMWPQDFIFLTALLVIAALGLFFFTAIGGRLWCGFACPQTVWTEAFLWMERLAEGSRSERMKLDKAGWSARKLSRKALKHALWIGFSLWTGVTFVGFFTAIESLPGKIAALSLGPWELFWILFYAFATYGNAGFLREQVCKYMCPYARFQSAMFDRDTMVVTYDEKRGEPRGSRRRGADLQVARLGSCVDCTLCVQVCPTGIDIRKGLQYECIACAACIDACDTVMDKMSYPRGLIRFTTQNALDNKPKRILRPRIVIYAVLLGGLVVAFGVGLAMRTPVEVDVIRDRNALYRLLDDGRVENVYNVKILNKTEHPHRFVIEVTGDGKLSLDPAVARYDVASGEVYSAAVRVRRPAYEPLGPQDVEFFVRAEEDPHLTAKTKARFLAPAQ